MSKKDLKQNSIEAMMDTLMESEACRKEMDKLIDKSIKNIEKAIEEVYYKYKKRYNLTDEEALKYLHDKIAPIEIKRYADMGLLAQADAMSVGNQITRLTMLKKYITTTMDVVEKQSTFYLEDMLMNVGNISKSRVYFGVSKEIGFELEFQKMPKKKMLELMKHEWCDGGNLYTRKHYAYGVTKQKLKETMVDGITRGISPQKMSANLQEISQITKVNADRLVRTEASWFHNATEMESYKELEIEKYMWISTLDGRTCNCGRKGKPSCAERDGKIYEVGGKDSPVPPKDSHPNCRCTTVVYMDDETRANLQRRCRTKDGKSIVLDKYMSYEDWYKKYN